MDEKKKNPDLLAAIAAIREAATYLIVSREDYLCVKEKGTEFVIACAPNDEPALWTAHVESTSPMGSSSFDRRPITRKAIGDALKRAAACACAWSESGSGSTWDIYVVSEGLPHDDSWAGGVRFGDHPRPAEIVVLDHTAAEMIHAAVVLTADSAAFAITTMSDICRTIISAATATATAAASAAAVASGDATRPSYFQDVCNEYGWGLTHAINKAKYTLAIESARTVASDVSDAASYVADLAASADRDMKKTKRASEREPSEDEPPLKRLKVQ